MDKQNSYIKFRCKNEINMSNSACQIQMDKQNNFVKFRWIERF